MLLCSLAGEEGQAVSGLSLLFHAIGCFVDHTGVIFVIITIVTKLLAAF